MSGHHSGLLSHDHQTTQRGQCKQRSQRGQATVEFALLLPVVVILLLVVIQVVLFARDTSTTIHSTQLVARAVMLEPEVGTAQRVVQQLGGAVGNADVVINGRLQPGEIVEVVIVVQPTRVPIVGMMLRGHQIEERLTFLIESAPS